MDPELVAAFNLFVAAAQGKIAAYEAALHRGDQQAAVQVLRGLEQDAAKVLEEWLRIEIYLEASRYPFAFQTVPAGTALPAAVRHYLHLINNAMDQWNIHVAAAAVQEIQELVAEGSSSGDDI